MLNFVLGVIVGGIVGFFVCAVFSINNSEKDEKRPAHAGRETGDSDA